MYNIFNIFFLLTQYIVLSRVYRTNALPQRIILEIKATDILLLLT